MPTTCVTGVLWGDEGKGKIIDLLARDADFVVRYGGGHNAGHTLIWRGERLVLHLVPSGILQERTVNVIGNGVVVDPLHLRDEVARLREHGVTVDLGRNLLVSERAPLILPMHQALDRVMEAVRGAGKIGTTGRGIGPAYADRAYRSGLRAGDLLRGVGELRAAVEALIREKEPLFAAHGVPPFDAAAIAEDLAAAGRDLAPAITDTGDLLRNAVRAGRKILFEGAQGVLLDVDLGTYPYVTSSNASPAGVPAGTGIPPTALDKVVGVMKAYATRVGEGPFPTEIPEPEVQRLRDAGNEYGSTTRRPRRCGWFDAVAVRYGVAVSGAAELYMTNLDVLSGFDPLRIAVAYETPAGRTDRFPAFDLDRVRPVWQEVPGFTGDLSGARAFADLPPGARHYVETLERYVGVPIRLVSVGPARDQVIQR
ncbi:MAG TPA: adenylosuccinate synthase [Planctomycetota bacterium]|nr:adenylosuccinate synthase [Planctomycetota bacterium]